MGISLQKRKLVLSLALSGGGETLPWFRPFALNCGFALPAHTANRFQSPIGELCGEHDWVRHCGFPPWLQVCQLAGFAAADLGQGHSVLKISNLSGM